jgi:GntR family transcriptional regulator / MocR family aminotransferase
VLVQASGNAYRRRRDLLVRALRSRLPDLEIRGAAAGMQLLLMLPNELDDVEIADAARSRGISALSPLHLTPRPDRGLLLGYGRLAEPSINEAVATLSTATAASTGKTQATKPRHATPTERAR